MSVRLLETRRLLDATLVLDLEDAYARDRGVGGPHPRPIGATRLLLAGEVVGGVRRNFPEPFALEARRNSDGYELFFGRYRLPDGRVVTSLPPGRYVVRVESDFYQRAERADVDLPEPAVPYVFDLQPGVRYPFPSGSPIPRSVGPTLLRGVLQDFGGAGVEGAAVEVVGQSNVCRTDDQGQWVLVFPDNVPSGNIVVRVTFPNGALAQAQAVPIVAGRESALAPTTLRGSVLTVAGVGIPSAEVTVTGAQGVAPTRPDGSFAVVFPLSQAAAVVDVTATLPDGRSQTRAAIPVQPRATVVVPTLRFP